MHASLLFVKEALGALLWLLSEAHTEARSLLLRPNRPNSTTQEQHQVLAALGLCELQ